MYICNNKYHLCFLMASNIKEISLRWTIIYRGLTH
jgi:hypothetical protein